MSLTTFKIETKMGGMKSLRGDVEEREITHAAVAANTSLMLAEVNRTSASEKAAVKPAMVPSRCHMSSRV